MKTSGQGPGRIRGLSRTHRLFLNLIFVSSSSSRSKSTSNKLLYFTVCYFVPFTLGVVFSFDVSNEGVSDGHVRADYGGAREIYLSRGPR